MRLIKFSLLLIIAVSFSPYKPVLAQDNYLPGNIVNLNGDTIKGFIEYLDWRINPEQVYFKQDQDKERELYKPGNIKSFQFSGFVFRSKIVNVSNLPRNENNANYLTIPNSRRLNKFLKLIVESDVSLYQLIDELDIDHYYIELPNDTLTVYIQKNIITVIPPIVILAPLDTTDLIMDLPLVVVYMLKKSALIYAITMVV